MTDLTRYPLSLRIAAEALWGRTVAIDRNRIPVRDAETGPAAAKDGR